MQKYTEGEKKDTKKCIISRLFVSCHLNGEHTKKGGIQHFWEKKHAIMAMDVLYSDLLKSIQVSPCIRDALGEGLNGIFNPLRIRKKISPAFRQ
jgi:hypothetical protein